VNTVNPVIEPLPVFEPPLRPYTAKKKRKMGVNGIFVKKIFSKIVG
jgi:hypothetical protein